MALPSNFYRDPSEILEQLERRTCRGCIYKGKAWGVEVCDHPKRHGGKAEKRCKYYQVGEQDK